MCAPSPLTVIKVGGSLLSMPNLAQRLDAVIEELGDIRPLIVCGGGEAADVVRRWQPVHGITDEQAHWLALRAMSLNELLLSQLLAGSAVARTRDEIDNPRLSPQLTILNAESFLRHEERNASKPLPHDWSVTSDSIAAWAASRLDAEQLVLLKSCDLPLGISLRQAAERGLVDEVFPDSAAGLHVTWVNVRANPPTICAWQV